MTNPFSESFKTKTKDKETMQEFNPNKRKIFDAHSHIGNFGKQKVRGHIVEPFKGREIKDAKDLEAHMKKTGINKCVIVPHYTFNQADAFENNKKVLEAIRLEGVYGGLWVSPLPENTERTKRVLESLPIQKIKALKICPQSWPKGKITMNPETWSEAVKENMEKIMAALKKHKLVLHAHTGTGNSDTTAYVKFVEKYGKGIKIQFVHMGSSPGGHFAFVPRFIEWLKQGYDFYCDTSETRGFAASWMIKELQEKYPKGLDRVLFATDNPWGVPESEFWKIESTDCEEEIKEKIFYENANELYK
ncbi:hypothetical protein DRJ25_04225 [Candidatus Woesearchaeota archaeon]|nr:MAG: hypothetical protein DRJ25_04225 [Candidatus Woesearchaeota archaeon]